MLNYYEKVAPKEEFIMDIEENGNYIVVTYADESTTKFPNNQISKEMLKKQYEKQLNKILEKYPVKKLKKKYNSLKKKTIQSCIL